MKVTGNCLALIISCVFVLLLSSQAQAVISGPCAGCHTMHNSQDNSPMRFDSGATPLPQLLRGDCDGCHAQGTNQALVSVGVDVIPQVYHTDGFADLAGGNFAYIDGLKGGIGTASESKGHNIDGLGSILIDTTLYEPPGGINQTGHNDGGNINTTNLTCAGTKGCHGNRNYTDGAGNVLGNGITGAHHDNVNGSIDYATQPNDSEPGHGYRFLLGVNGYEDTDWQYTKSDSDHNEYFGRSTPAQIGCDSGGLTCHGDGGVRPPNNTMAEYCATCHGNFHTLANGPNDGIGSSTQSPFIRHPSDLSLPASGEYALYTSYLVGTPIARLSVPSSPSSIVTPGADAVFCLSCHVAHASQYPDMLKWDYSLQRVGDGAAAAGEGCFACHTTKD